jgi:hypothetical protein
MHLRTPEQRREICGIVGDEDVVSLCGASTISARSPARFAAAPAIQSDTAA